MSEENKTSSKLKLSSSGKLSLKKSISDPLPKAGSSAGVTVEIRKKRGTAHESSVSKAIQQASQKETSTPQAQEQAFQKGVDALSVAQQLAEKNLQEIEKNTEEVQRQREEAARLKVEAQKQQLQEEEERKRALTDLEEEKRRQAEEETVELQKIKEQRLKEKEELAQKRLQEAEETAPPPQEEDKGSNLLQKIGGRLKQKKTAFQDPTTKKQAEPRRRNSRMTVAQALGQDEERTRSLASIRRRREKERLQSSQARQDGTKVLREVTLPETITVQELANRMAERGSDVVKGLMGLGVMATINQTIDADTAELVIEEFGHTFKRVSDSDMENFYKDIEDKPEDLTPRSPVVTVMGHVDHGKTSLLDALRKTDVVAGEAGGITQHIGAYQISLKSGEKVTFLDTPGHAAFSEMRSRGANVTDIVILVVAADDGIMPQTIEAISHAKAANVPIIVAVNKMDKPGADPTRVLNELLQHDLVPESFGGDVQTINVSALKKEGLDELTDALSLQSDVLELKANVNRTALGTVVETKQEKGRGSVATVLVQNGTLKIGDIFVAGMQWGKVRALINDRGQRTKTAGPGVPVEVLGLNGTASAGDDLIVVETEAQAREISEQRAQSHQDTVMAARRKTTLDQLFDSVQNKTASDLPVLIKADVHGSTEAIYQSLNKLSTDEVKVQVLHHGVGGITESDIALAKASNALILGFNVRANPQARDSAKAAGVDIQYYSIIYELIDDIKGLLSGLLKPELREKFIGYAQVREIFNMSKYGKVAGCMVTEGQVKRACKVRLLRDNVVIHEGTLKTLRRFKDEVKEVRSGMECGMAFEKYHDMQVGDQIECFEIEEIARTL